MKTPKGGLNLQGSHLGDAVVHVGGFVQRCTVKAVSSDLEKYNHVGGL